MVNISFNDIMGLVSLAFAAGRNENILCIIHGDDNLNKKEAERYVKYRGYKPVMLAKWEEMGLLRSVKTGEAQNCSRLYSLAEIDKLITSLKAKRICNDGETSGRVF